MHDMELLAPAKVNWGLEIVGQRPDGYHLLRSLMQTVDLYDEIKLAPASVDSCLRDGAEAPDDLALRAWLLLRERFAIPDHLALSIRKHIPIGGGLGGGSSDAAAVLRAVNDSYGLGLSQEQLRALGLSLGADVPYCLHGGLALVEGIGEQVTALPGREYSLLLVNPAVPVSTAAVYAGLAKPSIYAGPGVDAAPDLDKLRQALAEGRREDIVKYWGNALEKPAFSLKPQLYFMKEILRSGKLRCLLSGSGGTIFALMDDDEQAAAAAESFRHKLPWLRAVRTIA